MLHGSAIRWGTNNGAIRCVAVYNITLQHTVSVNWSVFVTPPSVARVQVLEIIKTQPEEGCTQEFLDSALQKVDGVNSDDVGNIIADSLNYLLKSGNIELLQQANGSLLYRQLDQDVAEKLRGLTDEEQAAYNKIKESNDQGIWTRELKKAPSPPQPSHTTQKKPRPPLYPKTKARQSAPAPMADARDEIPIVFLTNAPSCLLTDGVRAVLSNRFYESPSSKSSRK